MRVISNRRFLRGWGIALASVLLAGCTDVITDPDLPPGHARLAVQAAVQENSAVLVVEISGPGIGETLVHNIEVFAGVASGSLLVPAGSNRTFVARLYDREGIETHVGETVSHVRPRDNETVRLALYPHVGDQPIEVSIGSYTVTMSDRPGPGVVGGTVQLSAEVRDAHGELVPARVMWISVTPATARVDSTGLVSLLAPGNATIVAAYSGVGAWRSFEALETQPYIESIVGGAFRTWWISQKAYESAGLALSVAAWEHSSSHTNMRMWRTSRIPREPIPVSPAEAEQQVINIPWYNPYRAIAAVNDGLRMLPPGVMEPFAERRVLAWGRLVQGLAHGSIALLYDQGFVQDETADPQVNAGALRPYPEVMAAALDFLDQAIELAQGDPYSLPDAWVNGLNLTTHDVARLAHSYKARFMARVARTPAERQAANWGSTSTPGSILYHADRGVQEMFAPISNWSTWWDEIQAYGSLANWAQISYYHFGAADTGGTWQSSWINEPWEDRVRFVMVTPDRRWPQGTTASEQVQVANRGLYFEYTSLQPFQVGRGTYYMSHYRDHRFTYFASAGYTGPMTEFSPVELDLLKAEGHIYQSQWAQAAALINRTRVANGGLPSVDGSGAVPGGAACVPKRPDGSCGNLMDAMKWEKRNEVRFTGFAGFFYDDRGWGDLVPGTALHWPLPGRELEQLGIPLYTFGGGSAPDWEANLVAAGLGSGFGAASARGPRNPGNAGRVAPRR